MAHEGHVHCEACGFTHYAGSAPAVAAFLVDEQRRVLLARRAYEPDAGLWDTPGGFLDEGEDPESGLRRELLEETGLTIEIGDFVGMFTDRYGGDDGTTSVLNIVWEATVLSGEPRAADDVSELRWFAPDALPADDELAFRWVASALRAWTSATRQAT